jgi:hypothetical protein
MSTVTLGASYAARGSDDARRVACAEATTVLIVVDSVAAGHRLMEVVRLFEGDFRVRVVFSVPPGADPEGCVRGFLASVGGVVLAWPDVKRLRLVMAVTAGPRGVDELTCPVVLLGFDGEASPGVKPSVLALAHADQRTRLARRCPDAAAVAQVVGDPEFDRILASLPYRDAYRWALGAMPRQRLVVISCASGAASLLECAPELPGRLTSQLPRSGYRVVLLVQAGSWREDGGARLGSRLDDAVGAGARLISAETDRHAVIAAADLVIGDCGPTSLYAMAAGTPVALAAGPSRGAVEAGSALADLAALAPRVTPREPLLRQIEQIVRDYPSVDYSHFAARITSQPGAFARNMRELLYARLGLAQPWAEPTMEPAPPPTPVCRC